MLLRSTICSCSISRSIFLRTGGHDVRAKLSVRELLGLGSKIFMGTAAEAMLMLCLVRWEACCFLCRAFAREHTVRARLTKADIMQGMFHAWECDVLAAATMQVIPDNCD